MMDYSVLNQYAYEGKGEFISLLDFISTPVRGALGGRTINVETLEENSSNIITRVFYLFVSIMIFPIGLTGSFALGIKSLLNENPFKASSLSTEEEKKEELFLFQTDSEKSPELNNAQTHEDVLLTETEKFFKEIDRETSQFKQLKLLYRQFLDCLKNNDLHFAKLILFRFPDNQTEKMLLIYLLSIKQIEQGDLEEAIKTVKTKLNYLGDDKSELVLPIIKIGLLLIEKGQTDRALELANSKLLILEDQDRYQIFLKWAEEMPASKEVLRNAIPPNISYLSYLTKEVVDVWYQSKEELIKIQLDLANIFYKMI